MNRTKKVTRMSELTFAVAIFSYNRGAMLRNCVSSLRACCGECKIYIIDDNSDDPETKSVLSSLEHDAVILRPWKKSIEWHGGLYDNMNMALLELCEYDLVMFVQDDMQFVRRFGQDDFRECSELLSEIDGAAFLYPVFLKARTVDDLLLKVEAQLRFYESQNSDLITGRFYSDVFIASPRVLLASKWKFYQSELDNANQAKKIFSVMRYQRHPFVAYVPRPKTYRRRRKNLALVAIEYVFGFGSYRLQVMSTVEETGFRERALESLPIAETYLRVLDTPLKSPWAYSVFDLSFLVFPIYYFFENPIKYVQYQVRKRWQAIKVAFRRFK